MQNFKKCQQYTPQAWATWPLAHPWSMSSLESQVGLGWPEGAGEEVPGKELPSDLE